MSQSHSNADDRTELPSLREVIEDGNSTISKSPWFVLDDANIDSVTFGTIIIALVSILLFAVPTKLAAPAVASVVLPLRLFFPRAKPPTGLVLITGASSDVGAELGYVFAERGHDLILVGQDDEQLQAVKNNVEGKGGPSARTITLDLSVPGAAESLYNLVKNAGYTVDILVNNAGVRHSGETLDQPIELAERMVTLNCISLVQLTQLFGRDMAERKRGWILQVSSVGGWHATPHQNLFGATKSFVHVFSEALSIELRAYPGVINTQLLCGPTHKQRETRATAQAMAEPGAMKKTRAVAMAGYKGLSYGKRTVFGSWNAAFTSEFLQLVPRGVQLTVAGIMNSRWRGKPRAEGPLQDESQRDLLAEKE